MVQVMDVGYGFQRNLKMGDDLDQVMVQVQDLEDINNILGLDKHGWSEMITYI
jgi:hypothetical protein